MAKVDIEAIRKRLEQINDGSNRSGGSGNKFPRWKYEKPGTYHLRVLPFENTEPGVPFPMRIVYYGINATGGGMIVSPENAGGRDPIKEFRIGLYNQAREELPAQAEETKKMASLLKEKSVNSVAIIDRSNEATGPQMWSPNYTDVKQLEGLFLTDAGDYTDVKEGCDITLVVTQSKKVNQRNPTKPMFEATITADRKNTPAHADPTVVEGWLKNLPDVDAYYPITSTEETAKRLQEWIDAGANKPESDGTARGGATAAKKEADPEPTKPAEVKPVERKPAPKPPVAKKTLLAEVDDSMDDALDDLETET